MTSMFTKRSLAVELSKLARFKQPKQDKEQYATDGDTAAMVLWDAYQRGVLKEATVADLGCGTGILGIGALLLGAKQVTFVDIDQDALSILRKNLESHDLLAKATIIHSSIEAFNAQADLVVQNPPFGTAKKHIDLVFLEKAMQTAPIVYSLHKSVTVPYLDKAITRLGGSIIATHTLALPLSQTMVQHKRKTHRIDVTLLVVQR